jgi:PKHD-type hydroxylase
MLLLPELLSASELQQARALLAAGRWTEGQHTAGSQAARAKDNAQLAPADAPALQQLVLQALERSPAFFSAVLPKKVWPPAFNRYAGGQAYGDHVDQGLRVKGELRLRADLSCTLFLNEPTDYEGGELVIQLGGDERRVKGLAGSLLIYPAHTVHRVEPVTQGERLAAFFWIESLVRSGEQRELLWRMDQALTSLRSRDGESAEAVALMGTYHHLLRLWADS